jgi:hypothetical protein
MLVFIYSSPSYLAKKKRTNFPHFIAYYIFGSQKEYSSGTMGIKREVIIFIKYEVFNLWNNYIIYSRV